MNPIAAHKDGLKKLIENLSGDTAVSEITFVASLDAYYRVPRYELLRHQGRPNPPAAQTDGELIWNQH